MKIYPFEFGRWLVSWAESRANKYPSKNAFGSHVLAAFTFQVILAVWCYLLVSLGLWRP